MSAMAVLYINAVTNFLKSLPQVDDVIQKQQTELMLEKIKISSTAEAAAVVLALKELPVNEECMTALINKTTSLALLVQQSQQLGGMRRCLQDYTNIRMYMSPPKLLSLQSAGDKLFWFVQSCGSLGLTNPSEKTFQVMTALLLLSNTGHSQDLEPAVKFESLQAMKAAFVRSKKTARSDVYFNAIPQPSELLEKHADLATSFWGESGWVPTELDQNAVYLYADSIPMRSSRKSSKVQVVLGQKTDSSAAAFAQQLSQQMQQMQYMQAFTLQALQGQPVLAGSFGFLSNPQSTAAVWHMAPALHTAASALPIADAPHAAPSEPAIQDESKVEAQEVKEEETDAENQSKPSKPAARPTLDQVTKQIASGMGVLKKEASSKKKAQKKAAEVSGEDKPAAKKAAQSSVKGKANVQKGKAAAKKPQASANTKVKKKQGKESSPCVLSMARRLKLRPNGCGKCRNTPGCTPSCLRAFIAKNC